MANKLETTLEAVNGGFDYAILTGKSPIFPYIDGKKSGDSPIGFKFNLALLGNRLSPLSVKIEGSTDPLPKASDEMIVTSCRGDNDDGFLYVRLLQSKVILYSIDGQMVSTATAAGIEIVK